MKTFKHYIESTFAQTKSECRDKLKAISNYPEIKQDLDRIKIGEAVKHSNFNEYSLDGYCAYLLEKD